MNKWKCLKCGKEYGRGKNVGLCNSITEQDICLTCYNKIIKCDRCKKEIEDKEGNYFYDEDTDSVYCVACADYLDAQANMVEWEMEIEIK